MGCSRARAKRSLARSEAATLPPVEYCQSHGVGRLQRHLPLCESLCNVARFCIPIVALYSAILQAQPSSCARIDEPMARLACYDERERKEVANSVESGTPAPTNRILQRSDVNASSMKASTLEARWELRPELQRGIFNLVPHRPVYGLAHWTDNANENPFSPTRAFSQQVDLDRSEVNEQQRGEQRERKPTLHRGESGGESTWSM